MLQTALQRHLEGDGVEPLRTLQASTPIKLTSESLEGLRKNFKVLNYPQNKAKHYKCIEYDHSSPFSSDPGYLTNLGVVAPPSHPVNGYIFSGDRWLP